MRVRERTKGNVRGLLAVLCAGALVLAAACGDDNGNGVAEPDVDPTEDIDPGDITARECAEAGVALAMALGGAFAPGTDIDESFEVFDRFAAAAPPAVRADFEVLADAFEEVQRELDAAGVDFSDPASFTDPQVQQALEDVSAIFDDPAVQEASDNIDTFFDEVCP